MNVIGTVTLGKGEHEYVDNGLTAITSNYAVDLVLACIKQADQENEAS